MDPGWSWVVLSDPKWPRLAQTGSTWSWLVFLLSLRIYTTFYRFWWILYVYILQISIFPVQGSYMKQNGHNIDSGWSWVALSAPECLWVVLRRSEWGFPCFCGVIADFMDFGGLYMYIYCKYPRSGPSGLNPAEQPGYRHQAKNK